MHRGRPVTRLKAEDFLALDIRQLKAHGRLRAGTVCTWEWSRFGDRLGAVRIALCPRGLVLSYSTRERDIDQRIAFTFTPCRYGGLRTWFRCPDCARRCAVLYGGNAFGRFSCRHCMKLTYSVESENALNRSWRKQLKLEAKLSDGVRPERMWRRTYARLYDEIAECEDARAAAFFGPPLSETAA